MNDSSHMVNAKSLIHPKKILFSEIFVARMKPFLVLQTGKLQGSERNAWKQWQLSLVCLVGFTANELTSLVDSVDPPPDSSQRQRDLGDDLGQVNSKGACSSNKIFISICDWRLGKIDNDSPSDVGLLMCGYPNLSLFSKQEVLLEKRSWVKDLPFFPEKISYLFIGAFSEGPLITCNVLHYTI